MQNVLASTALNEQSISTFVRNLKQKIQLHWKNNFRKNDSSLGNSHTVPQKPQGGPSIVPFLDPICSHKNFDPARDSNPNIPQTGFILEWNLFLTPGMNPVAIDRNWWDKIPS